MSVLYLPHPSAHRQETLAGQRGHASDVSQSVGIPVLIGSGVTYDNVESYLDANAMIVGSHFKLGGHWANEVDAQQVKRFMGKIRKLRQ